MTPVLSTGIEIRGRGIYIVRQNGTSWSATGVSLSVLPAASERESFLSHLQQQGTSRKALRNLSAELLQVMRLLKLTEMRDVSLEEIQRAVRRWARQQRTNPKAHSYGYSASFFTYAANKWLGFHGRLKLPSAPPMRSADQLSDFTRYMTEEQGLSPHSVRSHCWKTWSFLKWFGERHRLLARARAEDVDELLAMKGTSGWLACLDCRCHQPLPPSGNFESSHAGARHLPHGFRMWVSFDNPEHFFCRTAVSGRIPGVTTDCNPERQSPNRSMRSRKLQPFRSISSWLTLYPPNCSSSKSTAYQVPFLRSRT
jgi:hypothetical protein